MKTLTELCGNVLWLFVVLFAAFGWMLVIHLANRYLKASEEVRTFILVMWFVIPMIAALLDGRVLITD